MGCAISEETMPVPGGFIKRTRHFSIHQDPLIPLPGFLVIDSTRHIQSLSEMDDAEYEDFARLLRDVLLAIKGATGIENLTIIQEERSVHFHLWFFPWTDNVIERYGQPSLTKIREIMTDLGKQPIDEIEWRELEGSINKIKAQMKLR